MVFTINIQNWGQQKVQIRSYTSVSVHFSSFPHHVVLLAFQQEMGKLFQQEALLLSFFSDDSSRPRDTYMWEVISAQFCSVCRSRFVLFPCNPTCADIITQGDRKKHPVAGPNPPYSSCWVDRRSSKLLNSVCACFPNFKVCFSWKSVFTVLPIC